MNDLWFSDENNTFNKMKGILRTNEIKIYYYSIKYIITNILLFAK
jgi:hypothetical protein